MTQIMEEMCGFEVSSGQVSRAAALLDEELTRWRTRPLEQATPYLILDARYEKVRQAGPVVSCAVLTATGVRADGKRTVLGVSVSLSEAETHWREFIASLQERGLHGVKMVTSDDHKGLTAALAARLPGVPWQRCQFHLQRNAAQHVPKVSMCSSVAADLRDVFKRPDAKRSRPAFGRGDGEAPCGRAAASRLDGVEHPDRPEGVPDAAGASGASADDEHAGEREQADQTTHARGGAVSASRICPALGERRAHGD